MGARLTLDRLDGLNKNMRDWDVAFYGRVFNADCRNSGMPTINFPDGRRLILAYCDHD